MKGKRKLSTLLLVAVMTMMMAVPVCAATTYTPVAGGSPTFKKYLVMDNNANVPAVTFTYTIGAGAAAEGSAGTLAVYAGNDANKVTGTPTIGTAPFAANSTTYTTQQDGDSVTLGTNQKYAKSNVNVDFSGVTYKEPGVYRYVISEAESTVSGITNDAEPVRTMDVYVEDDGTGLAIQGYVMYSGTVTAAPLKTNAGVDGATKIDGYTNTYASFNLEISKAVSGNQASKDEYFEFTVQLEDALPSTTYAVNLENAEATTTTNGVNTSTHTNAATITTDADGAASAIFWIQGGQSITIKGLTSGTKYTVSENGTTMTNEGYTTSIVRTIGTDAEAAIDATTISSATTGITDNTALAFTNTKEGVIPTGIILSAAGLLVVAVIVVAGIVFFGVRSRRKYEEE